MYVLAAVFPLLWTETRVKALLEFRDLIEEPQPSECFHPAILASHCSLVEEGETCILDCTETFERKRTRSSPN